MQCWGVRGKMRVTAFNYTAYPQDLVTYSNTHSLPLIIYNNECIEKKTGKYAPTFNYLSGSYIKETCFSVVFIITIYFYFKNNINVV